MENNKCSFYKICVISTQGCTKDQMEKCGLLKKGFCQIGGEKDDLVISVNQYIKACAKCVNFFILPRRNGQNGTL